MLRLTAESNIEEVIKQIGGAPKQITFATAVALTETAKIVKEREYREMARVFDRPTPWTMNSLFLRPATKANLEAIVWVKDDRATGRVAPDKYLNPEIKGGYRRPKAFEKALESVGALPPGWVVVPGTACKLDQYGNIPGSLIVQILSYFRAFGMAGYSANITDARKAKLARGTKKKPGFTYFVGRPGDGKLPLGIWQRVRFGHGSAIKPIFIFVDGASYRPAFGFERVARETFAAEFPNQMTKALVAANATAKP